MSTKIQHRGNCPCCGNQQAVLKSGSMSKHGYVVDHGWFNGVCIGQLYAPMQKDRTITDKIISDVRSDVEILLKRVADLKAGILKPVTALSGKRVPGIDRRGRSAMVDEVVPYDQAPEWQQEHSLKGEVYQHESRARAGTSFANDMEALVNRVHGQPLIEVKLEPALALILSGEQRKSARGVLTVSRVDGARVYWKDERGFKSWTGTAAWRRMENV